ncbi:hypothetical protein GA0070558_102320 [Micromonospora haikouensis]|uniref:Uncharacterized protein n=1 Tax=Micromonospora haikouensis TaxID=686309 RepID=A0A1C4U982_9ACTN|nr:hypothetical protein [Micromonospora haikouensis]SCE68263.1 hypothetical protein GA0070558_102320 [Micromonospora haikouensis]
MQRRTVTVLLAPLLAGALVLHLGLACRSPLDAVAVTVAPHPAVATASAADPGTPVRATARRVALEAYRLVTTLAAHTGQPPDPTVVPRFDGKACGSVSRSGRGNQGTDRRDPGPQAGSALPDAAVRRGSTADGRPATADAGPDPIRLSVLRC